MTGPGDNATMTIRVAPRDIDRHGRMFLGSYIAEAETALEHLWSTRPDIEREPLYVPTKTSCAIFHPLRLNEQARLAVKVVKIGGKSVGFTVLFEAADEAIAEVEITWQALDRDTEEQVGLPEDTRDWLYGYLD